MAEQRFRKAQVVGSTPAIGSRRRNRHRKLSRADERASMVSAGRDVGQADNRGMLLVENAFSSIVLTAQSFNPSVFTETWLSESKVLPSDKLTGVRVYSPQVAQFQTSEVQVLVVPPKMQITFPILVPGEGPELACSIAVRTVELLPHTPYQALGMNFDYFVPPPEGQDFNVYDRALFGDGGSKLLREFSAPDARFGRYFSRDYGEARLKLDVKPVKAGPQNKDLLQFSFNFHYALPEVHLEERSRNLSRMIGTWGQLRDYSQQLAELGSQL